MNARTLLGLLTIATVVAGCDSKHSAEPQAYGPLDSRITQGEKQAYTAGGDTPEIVVDLVYRNPLTGSVRRTRPPAWERVLLPALAYALQAVNLRVQPNSVVCVKQPYGELVPELPCVNSDSAGNTRFDFLPTTKAGTHVALIQATYGVETTVPDTVEITVTPDVFYRSSFQTGAGYDNWQLPATFPTQIARDRYDNPVAFRLEFETDAYSESWTPGVQYPTQMHSGLNRVYVRMGGTTLGSTEARTVVAVDSIVGPESINGRSIARVCGYVRVVTAGGLSARGNYALSRYGPWNAITLETYQDLATEPNC